MNVLKKFWALLCMAAIVLGVVGCGSDKSDKPKETKPPPAQTTQQQLPENVPPAANTKVKFFGADLNLTQEEFVAAYNYALDELAKQDGKNYDAYKLDLNNPKQVKQRGNAINFYSGQERCEVSLLKNAANPSQICNVATIGRKSKISDFTTEMVSAIFASTRGLLKTSQEDAANVKNAMVQFLISALKSPDKSKATSVNGLVIYYNAGTANFFEIIAEDAPNKTSSGKKRIVDDVRDYVKQSNYWQE